MNKDKIIKLSEAVQNMIAVETAAQHCPDCCPGAFCVKHDRAFWECWKVVKNAQGEG